MLPFFQPAIRCRKGTIDYDTMVDGTYAALLVREQKYARGQNAPQIE